MNGFQPLSKERAEEIRKALEASRGNEQAFVLGETGECLGTGPVLPTPDDQRNMIAKFDTHYASNP